MVHPWPLQPFAMIVNQLAECRQTDAPFLREPTESQSAILASVVQFVTQQFIKGAAAAGRMVGVLFLDLRSNPLQPGSIASRLNHESPLTPYRNHHDQKLPVVTVVLATRLRKAWELTRNCGAQFQKGRRTAGNLES